MGRPFGPGLGARPDLYGREMAILERLRDRIAIGTLYAAASFNASGSPGPCGEASGPEELPLDNGRIDRTWRWIGGGSR
jgi:hypothetical protein